MTPEYSPNIASATDQLLNEVLTRKWEGFSFRGKENSSPATQAYKAGLFDHALVDNISPFHQSGWLHYGFYVGYTDTKQTAVDFVTSLYPEFGHIYSIEEKPPRRKRYLWKITDTKEALTFLTDICPSLYVRRSEGELLKEFLDQRMKRRTQKISPEERIANDARFYTALPEIKKQVTTKPYMPTPETLGGMVDGGLGTIALDQTTKDSDGYPTPQLILSFDSIHPGLIHGIAGKYDSLKNIHTHTPHLARHDEEPSYELRMWGDSAKRFMEDVIGYTRFRTPILLLALEFLNIQEPLRKLDTVTKRTVRANYGKALATIKNNLGED